LSTLSTPSADQLAAARLVHWRHNADPILTINMLRDWLNASGLVLFTPRAAQLPAPAPSFVEATLGVANAAPALADTEQSRSLLSRLIADGGAIPLNLLGNPTGVGTETPDFIVSPLAFPYIFTLRGDKAWKQPPATSGATKVSPLALNTYTLLSEQAKDSGLSAYDLATQLGKEVTETAVLRALTELWQHLRVLPVPQADGASTLWELTSTRFTKQIKAGANAGQPTALSALISLYLGQAIVASEEEIETFLSPIAARSRIRDVVHALLSARQLETVAVEGRTVLHVTGELPAFLAVATPAPDDIDSLVVTTEGNTVEPAEPAARITKFIPKPRKVGTGFVTKSGHNTENRPTPRERRPFTREANRPDRPSFTKPWAEEKADRLAAAQSPSRIREDDTNSSPKTPRTYDRKSATDRTEKRPPFGSKPSFGSKPRFSSDRPSFKSDRPAFRRDEGSSDSRPPRREFTPRPYKNRAVADSASDRPRKTFSKPGTFGRKREGFAGKPSFTRGSDSRPPRRDYGDSRPPRREFTPRPEGDARPPRRNFADKSAKPSFGSPRKPGSFSARPQRSFDSSDAPRKTFSRNSSEGRTSRTDGPPFRKFDAPRSPRPFRAKDDSDSKPRSSFGAKKPYGKSSGNYAAKSSSSSFPKKPGSFAGKKPFTKSAKGATGKPAGTFDKFKGNKKPFGKRPPARKFKPKEEE
jgi:23S rRNA pseudouridine2605 synthase